MEAPQILRKLQTGELNEIGVELCVECPMYGRRVPVKDNCINLRLREDGQRMFSDVRLHGEPSDFSYIVTKKCKYCNDVTSKPVSSDLKSIICVYPKK